MAQSNSRKHREKINQTIERYENNLADESPLYEYAYSNVDILRKDPTMKMIYLRYISILFTDGLSFKIRGRWDKPTRNFQSIVDNHWIPFLSKALRYIFCHGFLVWFACKSKTGVEYPDVPDDEQVEVKWHYDPVTGASVPQAMWNDVPDIVGSANNIKSILYVMISRSDFGNSANFRFSLIDAIKGNLYNLYKITEARLLTGHRIARPPFVVSTETGVRYQRMRGATTNIDSSGGIDTLAGAANFEMNAAIQANNDDSMLSRLEDLEDKSNYAPLVAPGVLPTEVRTNILMNTRADYGKIPVPGGLYGEFASAAGSDLDYVNTRRQTMLEILTTAGLINEHTMTATAMKTYHTMFSGILTDIFNIFYDNKHLYVANVKPTFAQENRRTVHKGDITVDSIITEMSDEELANEINARTEVYLTSHVYSDIELSTDMHEQGQMSSLKFFSLFPEARLQFEQEAQLAALLMQDKVRRDVAKEPGVDGKAKLMSDDEQAQQALQRVIKMAKILPTNTPANTDSKDKRTYDPGDEETDLFVPNKKLKIKY